jgi:hypothetical protein
MTNRGIQPSSAAGNLPIVFIHSGGDSYLACSFTQAWASNPGAQIILVGDRFNRGFAGVTHVERRDFNRRAEEFSKVYRHYNSNSPDYERFCFQRWLVLYEMLEARRLPGCLYLDSDVLLYERIEKLAPQFENYDLTPSRFSPHCMFILRRETLGQFCDFLFECYQAPEILAEFESRYTKLSAAGKQGGACDMTAFELYEKKGRGCVADLELWPRDHGAFDHAMGDPHGGFEMQDGVKHIEWRDNQPWGFHIAEQKWVRFNVLHFQGPAKGRIFRHTRLKGLRQRTFYLWNRLIAKRGKYLQKLRRGP